jgi:hypothetical protein
MCSLETLELGVTTCGDEVEGAMVAYVLLEPTPSAVSGPCGAVAGGAATAVVMAVDRCRKGTRERALADEGSVAE